MKNSVVLRVLAILLCAFMLCACFVACDKEDKDPTGGNTGTPSDNTGTPPTGGSGGGTGGDGPENGGGSQTNQLAYGLFVIGDRMAISNYDASGKFLGTDTVNACTMTYDYGDRMFVHTFAYGDDGKLKTVNFAFGLSMEVFEELTVAEEKVTAKGANVDMELTYDQSGKLVSERYTDSAAGMVIPSTSRRSETSASAIFSILPK